MKRKYNIALLGATGAVGQEMLSLLEERNFPVNNLIPLASARSAGKDVDFCGEKIKIKEATSNSFAGADIVFGAVGSGLSRELASSITNSGAIFIDNSSAFRMNDDVPLVVPEINPEDAKKHKGIIANPNCSTIITAVAVNPISKLSPIKSMVVSTYQAVSGAGAAGPQELLAQVKALLANDEIKSNVFQYQIAENLIPHIGSFLDNDYTDEEMKLQREGSKILHLPDLKVSCTCVRVPVIRSHSISACVVTESQVSIEAASKAIDKAPGCKLYDDKTKKQYPMPLITSNQDIVYVGRLRKDLTNENGIALWCCGDQVRKGAATNAIQIAELFID
ncbi:MAG: aspartate-semialdehyde dehydrogenase [Eubacteriales bacterium]|nr:aspartate-semialdehyde dehydrogenase [Eubacteriales bacterium]MDD4390637.1 aspartate-semialdehyde dehydrogenase [Eubacteriales bacterium]